MRDLRKGRKLKRVAKQRKALLRGLAANLILRGKMKTTTAKAKELRPFVERLVSNAKHGTLYKERSVRRVLPKTAAAKLVHDIAPRYQNRHGGYTRIIKTKTRTGDAAPMAVIEFV
ncbi:50S ribosomal protein L17 [Candidatus Giovannonibacteria bacterium RIFCSPHIGHO2_02_FULL_46_20]|uniref:50S ribosomal protein L17 n=1 Tax=Candidatus Giovannonibacteria bacterium RIFCSPHIGHO2_02_FULL_46_20 TaxID=1798338 RepID=A0A1F5WEH8_9BACT|nr:MAG: 50S ribosomal protein L17 [Candidatus Giovannonibacteria bacterium RIFCSPHIGHO2_02_FULL_46_20]